ncbi:MAG: hypothetical protein D6795_00415 [Deltaproteobacteria bacterium]|nr:MAG: hypothetical protein D6795_00415 [Deltaproteobacteria bacterium]
MKRSLSGTDARTHRREGIVTLLLFLLPVEFLLLSALLHGGEAPSDMTKSLVGPELVASYVLPFLARPTLWEKFDAFVLCPFHLLAVGVSIAGGVGLYVTRRARFPSWRWGVGIWIGLLLFHVAWLRPWNDERSLLAAADFVHRHGLERFFAAYGRIEPWLAEKHPPLVPVVLGLLLRFVGPSLPITRGIGIVSGGVTLWFTARLARLFRCDPHRSVLVLAAFPIFFWSSGSVLLDMPATAFFTMALFHLLRYVRGEGKESDLFVAALGAGASCLVRYNAVVIYPIAALFLWRGKATRRAWIRFFTLPVVMLLAWGSVLFVSGTATLQFRRLTRLAATLLGSAGGGEYTLSTLLPLFPVQLGIHLFPLLLAAFPGAWREEGGRTLLLWGGGVCLFVLLTLPVPRYLLPALPPLSIVAAEGLAPLDDSPFLLRMALFETFVIVALYDFETNLGMTYIFY